MSGIQPAPECSPLHMPLSIWPLPGCSLMGCWWLWLMVIKGVTLRRESQVASLKQGCRRMPVCPALPGAASGTRSQSPRLCRPSRAGRRAAEGPASTPACRQRPLQLPTALPCLAVKVLGRCSKLSDFMPADLVPIQEYSCWPGLFEGQMQGAMHARTSSSVEILCVIFLLAPFAILRRLHR